MRVTANAGYPEARDAVSHDWPRWLGQNGFKALLIPNIGDDPGWALRHPDTQCLVLTGGNDVVSSGQNDDVSAERNRTERFLLESAVANDVPVFGVCRGLHMINAFFGGTVSPNIEALGFRKHAGVKHQVEISAMLGGVLALDSFEIQVNSYHNQGVRPEDLAPDLRAFAWSVDDGLIEGIVHLRLPILAVQWHPERDGFSNDLDGLLFGRLTNERAFWT